MDMSRRAFVSSACCGLGALAAAVPQARAAGSGFRFDPNASYSMPAHFPRGALPDRTSAGAPSLADYLDVTTMSVTYRTDAARLASLLPAPLTPADDPTVTVFYSLSREVQWLAGASYSILGANASAVFRGEEDEVEGAFSLVLWENDTDAIIRGREGLGIPKIYADIEDYSVFDGTWRTSATHRGHTIVDMMIGDLRPVEESALAAIRAGSASGNWMGWRYIPNVGRPGAALSHATLVPTSARPERIWTGRGDVVWRRLTWQQNPTQYHIANALADLPMLEQVSASVVEGSTSLRVVGRTARELR